MTTARDLVGYGASPPTGTWPNGARLAISIVVNYEEGSERSHAMGDPDQESMTEWGNYPMPPEIRNLAMESMYEYGARVGIWRLLEIMKAADVRSTFFACGSARGRSASASGLRSSPSRRPAADGQSAGTAATVRAIVPGDS
jgi:peptidoglycan/xylan/chitin deacetylase (PgdA/CDA1 family)